MRIKCIIFDMDDTLLKLNVNWKKLTKDVNEKYFGGKYADYTPHKFFVAYFSRLMNKLSKKQQKEIYDYRLRVEKKGIPTGVCFPYANILNHLSKKYKLGVVSGNLKPTVHGALKHCGIHKYFKAIVSIEAAPYSKPSPLPIWLALKKLKCKPYHAVYIGDHVDDIKAGRKAGMKTIGVLSHRFTKKELKEFHPNITIRDFSELYRALNKLERT